jgi:hypothetical protein
VYPQRQAAHPNESNTSQTPTQGQGALRGTHWGELDGLACAVAGEAYCVGRADERKRETTAPAAPVRPHEGGCRDLSVRGKERAKTVIQ